MVKSTKVKSSVNRLVNSSKEQRKWSSQRIKKAIYNIITIHVYKIYLRRYNYITAKFLLGAVSYLWPKSNRHG